MMPSHARIATDRIARAMFGLSDQPPKPTRA
jgi:hypothetical protein